MKKLGKNIDTVLISIIFFNIIINLTVLFYIYYSNNGSLKASPDGIYYLEVSNAIRNLNGETVHYGDIGKVIMPGYPLLISLFFENIYIIVTFQILLFSLSIALLFKTINLKFIKFYTSITLILIILSTSWDYHAQPLIESTTISFLIISMFFLVKYLNLFNKKDILLFSLFFGILISINNRFILHFLGLMFFFFFLKIFERRISIKYILLGILIVGVILLPWHIRQYLKYDRIILFSEERSNFLEKSNKSDENSIRIARYAKFKEFLEDSINNTLKNDPKEFEASKKAYEEQTKLWREEREKLKAVGKPIIETPVKIVYEPATKRLEEEKKLIASNDNKAFTKQQAKLIQERKSLVGLNEKQSKQKKDKTTNLNNEEDLLVEYRTKSRSNSSKENELQPNSKSKQTDKQQEKSSQTDISNKTIDTLNSELTNINDSINIVEEKKDSSEAIVKKEETKKVEERKDSSEAIVKKEETKKVDERKDSSEAIVKKEETKKVDEKIENIKNSIVKSDTQFVIKKKVIPSNISSNLNNASSHKIIKTDTLIVVQKTITDTSTNSTGKKKQPIILKDTVPTVISSNLFLKKHKEEVIEFEDDKMFISIEGIKVKQIKVSEFKNEDDFKKFDLLKIQKMVPNYDIIIESLLERFPKYSNNIDGISKLLSDFSYNKYVKLVEEKPIPSLITNYYDRFINQLTFFRTDFQLTPRWDPRIYVPSWYNHPLNLVLSIIMLPLIFINLIPLIIAIYKKNYFIIALFILIILHLFLHSIVDSIPRYRVSIYPAWITFAVYGYDQITRYIIHFYKNRAEYKQRISKFLNRKPKELGVGN